MVNGLMISFSSSEQAIFNDMIVETPGTIDLYVISNPFISSSIKAV